MKKIFDQELYKRLPVNDLIIFSIYTIAERGGKCNFEKLVKESFLLFPKIFSFNSLSQWPDARKLDRPLRALRDEKNIEGNLQADFGLSPAGKKKAADLAKIFRQRKLEI